MGILEKERINKIKIMEDYLKDFEYFGFNSELEMMTKIVSDANESTEKIHDEETGKLIPIQDRNFNEIMTKWFDDNEPQVIKDILVYNNIRE